MRGSTLTDVTTGMCIVFTLCFLLAVSGCSLMEIKQQTSLVDNSGTIKGRIEVSTNQKGPVMVLRFMDEEGIAVLQRSAEADSKGMYEFAVIPGKYYLAAYIDTNRDGKYQTGEHGIFFGEPTPIEVREKEIVTVKNLTISGPMPKPAQEIKLIDKQIAAWKNIGQIVSLDDPRFTLENYETGLWKPIDFLKKAEGGIFFLEEFKKDKIPILFVHGVVGGPTLWKEVIASMDRDHFQPWLCYYPSGLRLDTISDYLEKAVSQLQHKYNVKEFYVVAHSMGGLLARSFAKKYVAAAPGNSEILKLMVTVNSPMAGMSSAASGVTYSPIIVPSWRDVAPGSDFLEEINSWDWPKGIQYHLFVSYLAGESDDGVVPLQSQAQPKLQSEATRMYLYNAEHSEIIDNEEFHQALNSILSNMHGQ